MKPVFFILLTLTASLSWAVDTTKAAAKDKAKSEVNGDVAVNDALKKMLEVKGVQAIYDQCKKDNPTGIDKIPDCIWKVVEKDKAMKASVLEIYANESKNAKPAPAEGEAQRAPASKNSDKTILTDRKMAVDINYESDPAVQALSNFYGKKLDEILNPEKVLTEAERKEGKILVVDHRKFIDLYTSELGKTIVSAFTSYCLDTSSCDSKGICLIKEDKDDRKKAREDNMKSLKTGTIDLKADSAEGAKWISCIVGVTPRCEKDANSIDEIYSKQRACLVVDYIKSARKNLILADKQKAFYNELEKNNGYNIAQNTKQVTDASKYSNDSLLEMTSKDVTDSLKTTTDTSKKDMESCYDEKTKTIISIEACKKFLNTNTNANTAAVAEFGMRQIAQEETLQEELKSDDRVRDYLKEEGMKDEEIQKLTADPTSIKEVRDEIMKRFKSEKEAIIAEMAKRIEDKTTVTDGKVTQTDQPKIEKIRNEISNRSTDLANLVQFNNVVASYLTIEVDGKKDSASRNTASLFAESKVMEKGEAEALKKQIDAAQLKEQKESSNLDVKTMNDVFLNYETTASKKAKDANKNP